LWERAKTNPGHGGHPAAPLPEKHGFSDSSLPP
jgi:hypothetical protein